jgi:hypothetical protein
VGIRQESQVSRVKAFVPLSFSLDELDLGKLDFQGDEPASQTNPEKVIAKK